VALRPRVRYMVVVEFSVSLRSDGVVVCRCRILYQEAEGCVCGQEAVASSSHLAPGWARSRELFDMTLGSIHPKHR